MENLAKAFKLELWFWFINQGLGQKIILLLLFVLPCLFREPIWETWHVLGLSSQSLGFLASLWFVAVAFGWFVWDTYVYPKG